MRCLDLSEQEFGRLTARLLTADRTRRQAHWLCDCKCGSQTVVTAYNLRAGHTTSCGCISKENIRKIALTQHYKTHGKARTPIYKVWDGMLARTRRKTDPAYDRYGGRGITVAEDWLHFENFYRDMGDRPPGMTLERKDNNGPYCKENCVWASRLDQTRNRRTTRRIAHNGQTKLLSEWAAETGLTYEALWLRLRKGWSVERALTTPSQTENMPGCLALKGKKRTRKPQEELPQK